MVKAVYTGRRGELGTECKSHALPFLALHRTLLWACGWERCETWVFLAEVWIQHWVGGAESARLLEV